MCVGTEWSVPDQVHRLVFMHYSIVCPFFMQELKETQAHDKSKFPGNKSW